MTYVVPDSCIKFRDTVCEPTKLLGPMRTKKAQRGLNSTKSMPTPWPVIIERRDPPFWRRRLAEH